MRFRPALLAAVLLGTSTVAAQEIDKLLVDTQMVFRGTVVKVPGTTVTAIKPGPRTAIVRVDRVFEAPAVLGKLEGKRITVLLRARPSAKAGQQAVFFATSWLYGDSVAVKEVGRLGRQESDRFSSETLAAARARLADDRLRSRIAEAEVVVRGRVIDTRPGPPSLRSPTPTSEHDPDWWAATIRVAEVLKGRVETPELMFLFANSIDVQWMRAPKFKEGDEGVFLLKRAAVPAFPTGNYLTLIDPEDFLPPQQLERVKQLLR